MAIRSVFYRFCLKKAQVPNVPNGRFFYEKGAFGSISLEACVKNGRVPNVPNGLGYSKGLRARKQRSVGRGWGGSYKARKGRSRSKTHIRRAVACCSSSPSQPPKNGLLHRRFSAPPALNWGYGGRKGTCMLLVSSNGLPNNRHVDRLTLRYT